MKKKRFKTILSGVILLLVMAMIFSFSAKTADESVKQSGHFVAAFIKLFIKDFPTFSAARQMQIETLLSSIIRECAHCCEYGVLGISLMLHLNCFSGKFITAYIIGMAYSVSDEIHQIFVPGRAFQLVDIIIDCTGLFLGAGFVFILMKLIDRKRQSAR